MVIYPFLSIFFGVLWFGFLYLINRNRPFYANETHRIFTLKYKNLHKYFERHIKESEYGNNVRCSKFSEYEIWYSGYYNYLGTGIAIEFTDYHSINGYGSPNFMVYVKYYNDHIVFDVEQHWKRYSILSNPPHLTYVVSRCGLNTDAYNLKIAEELITIIKDYRNYYINDIRPTYEI
ncbi:MAG: hypothetical protein ACRDD8_10570 [Bacteroidales bacterium]